MVSNKIYAITEDKDGNLWFGTPDGVSVLLNEEIAIEHPNTIIGRVYFDKNQNQKIDNSENGVANQRILIQPGNRSAITNETGEYSFKVDTGLTYTLSYLPRNNYTLTEDTTFTFKTDSSLTLPELGIYREDTLVVLSNIALGNVRCVEHATNYYTFMNAGTVTGNANLTLTLDPEIDITNSYPKYDSLVNNKVYYSFDNFKEGSTRQIKLSVINPSFTRMGDTLISTSDLTMNGYKFNAQNAQMVRCSYDPNDKAVSPLPYTDKNYSLKDQTLHYTIRFQNTGNDTAYYVGIKDTLDPNLDWETFTVLATSHNVHTTLDENGLVLFEFDNIYLPDSTTDEAGSNGFISYSIHPKQEVPEFTIVENTAYIYFDKNSAVITNTTVNNLVTEFPSEVVTAETYVTDNAVYTLSPNPVTGTSELHFQNKGNHHTVLTMLDISGKVVFSKSTTGNKFDIEKSDFQNPGLYFYQVQNERNITSGKVLVE